MSTARLFKPIPELPREEIERQRDVLQARNVKLVLTLQSVQAFFKAGPVFDSDGHRMIVVGWDEIGERVDENCPPKEE